MHDTVFKKEIIARKCIKTDAIYEIGKPCAISWTFIVSEGKNLINFPSLVKIWLTYCNV